MDVDAVDERAREPGEVAVHLTLAKCVGGLASFGSGVRTICCLRLTAEKPLPYGYPRHPKTLGEHLRKAQIDRAMNQGFVANLLGCTEQTIRF